MNFKLFFISLGILSILAIFFFCFLIFFFLSNEKLYGDEVFYWFQAKEINENFRFVNFQNTQPLLYPLILSSYFNNLDLARLINALFLIMAGIILAFYLLKDSFQIVSSPRLENREKSSQIIYSEIEKNKLILIIFASILFFFSPYTIFSAISLHTEAIFTLFLILIFYFFPKVVNKPSFKNLIIFGLISGLTLQTRITGILVLVFLFLYLLFKKKLILKHSLFFFISFLIFLPYLFLGGLQFLGTKTSPVLTLETHTLMLINRFYQAFYFWWPFLILIILGSYFVFKEKNEIGQFHFFFIIFALITSILTPFSFARYWYILVPSLIVLICQSFIYLLSFIKPKYIYILFLILILLQFKTVLAKSDFFLPNLYYGNHYFLKVPSDCLEIKKVSQAQMKNNFQFEIINKNLELPYFEQPKNSIFNYSSRILPDKDYKFIILNYVDDDFSLSVNSKSIAEGSGTFVSQIYKINLPAQKPASIDLLVYNSINIGGIGQILLCQKNPYQ